MDGKYRGAVFACQGILCHLKAGAGDEVGKGMWSGVRHLEK